MKYFKEILTENGKYSLGRTLVVLCGICAFTLSIIIIIKSITKPEDIDHIWVVASALWGLVFGGKIGTKLGERKGQHG